MSGGRTIIARWGGRGAVAAAAFCLCVGPMLATVPAVAQESRGVQMLQGGVGAAAPVAAERRIALVIGNGAYQSVTHLANPPNDARAVAEAMRAAGFELVGGKALLDLDRSGTEQAIRSFGQKLRGGNIGLFYYAGHGVQINGANYLVPVSANLASEADVKYELVDVNYVLDEMVQAGNRLNVVILDACRNNPFGGRGMRAVSSGLAQMQAPSGTVISYATQPGNVAADGADGHSPFTEALTASIRAPGRTVFEVFNDVGVTVKKKTGGIQQPWLATSPIEGQFFFVPPAASAVAAEPARPAAAPPYIPTGPDKEALYWESIKDSNDAAFYRAYLDQFPNGVFAGLARAKLAALPSRAAVPAAAPAPVPAAAPPAATSFYAPPAAQPSAASFYGTTSPAKGNAPAVRPAQVAALPSPAPMPAAAGPAFDPETVPYLSDAQKARLAGYVAATSPKVLAIGSNGLFAWFGKGNSDADLADLRRRALERCQFANRAPCLIYAVDDRVAGSGTVLPQTTPVTLRLSGRFDPAAVPFITQSTRDVKMPEYAAAPNHKALALHPAGTWQWVSRRATAEQAKADALERCTKVRARGCQIYAVDDDIVFDGRAPDPDDAGGGVKAVGSKSSASDDDR